MTATLRTDLRPFLEPATAVVLGASERNSVAGQFVRNLQPGGCLVTGTHPVNRELGGAVVVPSISDLDHVPDLACVGLGAGNVVAGVEAALEHGTRHFVVPGLGPETGPAGAAARIRLAELCEEYDARMVGPELHGRDGAGRRVGLDRQRARPACGPAASACWCSRARSARPSAAWAPASASAAWCRAATRSPATPPTGWRSTPATRARRRSG